jgi:hypothetical protein
LENRDEIQHQRPELPEQVWKYPTSGHVRLPGVLAEPAHLAEETHPGGLESRRLGRARGRESGSTSLVRRPGPARGRQRRPGGSRRQRMSPNAPAGHAATLVDRDEELDQAAQLRQLIEDIALWIERCAVGGRLSHRARMADQLRSGEWLSMPARRTAPHDIDLHRAQRKQLLGQPLSSAEAAALQRQEQRHQAQRAAWERSMTRFAQAGGEQSW